MRQAASRPASLSAASVAFVTRPSPPRRSSSRSSQARSLTASVTRWRPLFISLLATVGAFQKEQIASIANLSRWAFLLTFAGVGLKTDFRELKKQGMRPFVVGALAELFITVVTLGLVLGAAAVFHL